MKNVVIVPLAIPLIVNYYPPFVFAYSTDSSEKYRFYLNIIGIAAVFDAVVYSS